MELGTGNLIREFGAIRGIETYNWELGAGNRRNWELEQGIWEIWTLYFKATLEF
jgi:hypothetical protein